MGLLEKAIVSALPLVPRAIMRRISGRYIAGETLEEAVTCLTDLRARGYSGVIDLLGEDVHGEPAARRVMQEYEVIAQAMHTHQLDAYVSVKPTHFGLRTSRDLALELYAELARSCASRGQFLRVEMEDHTTTDDTLWIFAELRRSFANVGIVLQSRLMRTPDDIRNLPPESDVRMVKGIYIEPAAIAHTDYVPIRDAFVAACEQLWRAGHRIRLATHDEHMAARCLQLAADLGVARDRYEFEVLLGVQQPLWERWRARNYGVRVYVPFGPDWRAYSTRRLKKNPAIAGHVLRALLRGR
ncbi:MAG: proline dehydrogenase family protein [Planctomycetota bacterium]